MDLEARSELDGFGSSSIVRPRMLFVGPPVFSYHFAIAQAYERLGFDVIWWDDRAGASSIYKLGLRLWPERLASLATKAFERRFDAIDGSRLSEVVVIKGESFSREFIQYARRVASNARFSLYLWDSTENAPSATRLAPYFDNVSTFDPEDARRHGWGYRPLFARSSVGTIGSSTGTYDWSFIGTLHADRHRAIYRLRRRHPELQSYVFAYAPSRTLLLARLLTDWTLWAIPPDRASARALGPTEVECIRTASKAVVDIEHPRQRGLTMRTIETLLAGKKLVTTNEWVSKSDLYEPTRVQIISRTSPTLSADFLASAFSPIDDSIRGRYTIEAWARAVIGECGGMSNAS